MERIKIEPAERVSSCFICSSPGVTNLCLEWGSGQLVHKVVTTIGRYLLLPPPILGKDWDTSSPMWVCPTCTPGLESVRSLNDRISTLRLRIGAVAESLGKRVLLAADKDKRKLGGREKTLWRKFQQPVIQNYVVGKLPNPSVRVEIDQTLVEMDAAWHDKRAREQELKEEQERRELEDERKLEERRKQNEDKPGFSKNLKQRQIEEDRIQNKIREKESRGRINLLLLGEKGQMHKDGEGHGWEESSWSDSDSDLDDIFEEKVVTVKKDKPRKSESKGPAVTSTSKPQPLSVKKSVKPPPTVPISPDELPPTPSSYGAVVIRRRGRPPKVSLPKKTPQPEVAVLPVKTKKEPPPPTPSLILHRVQVKPQPKKVSKKPEDNPAPPEVAVSVPPAPVATKKPGPKRSKDNPTPRPITPVPDATVPTRKPGPKRKRIPSPLHTSTPVAKKHKHRTTSLPETETSVQLAPPPPEPEIVPEVVPCPAPGCSETFVGPSIASELSSHYFLLHIPQAAKLSKTNHSFKCKSCDWLCPLTVKNIGDATSDQIAGVRMATHFLELHEPRVKALFDKIQTLESSPENTSSSSLENRPIPEKIKKPKPTGPVKQGVAPAARKSVPKPARKPTPAKPSKEVLSLLKDQHLSAPQVEEGDQEIIPDRRKSLRKPQPPPPPQKTPEPKKVVTPPKKRATPASGRPGPRSRKSKRSKLDPPPVGTFPGENPNPPPPPPVAPPHSSEANVEPRKRFVAQIKTEPEEDVSEEVEPEEDDDYDRKSHIFLIKKNKASKPQWTEDQDANGTLPLAERSPPAPPPPPFQISSALARLANCNNVPVSRPSAQTTSILPPPVVDLNLLSSVINSICSSTMAKNSSPAPVTKNDLVANNLVTSPESLSLIPISHSDLFHCPICQIPWTSGYEPFLSHYWNHKTPSEQRQALDSPIGADIPQPIREELISGGRSPKSFTFTEQFVAELILYGEEESSPPQNCVEIARTTPTGMVAASSLYGVEIEAISRQKLYKCSQCEHTIATGVFLGGGGSGRNKQAEIKMIVHFLQEHFDRSHVCACCGQGFSNEYFIGKHMEDAHPQWGQLQLQG